ncbi:sarcosine oxidase subunit gamma family protein [Marinobacter nanhaiticus D15-8W]|uniref:Sarcosine oxidase subunit gamma n=1 Tax=Marinobacter nanhaiticus D15-8W TaxID=626887 RepID=N6WR04_9GAMM|nr:sarcosine oxidase subunit gamma family protein [Marinobacter nanhaiticus]ENO14011.1 sarcosine oxidase subunit gamma [Marinobacter nanhaiticus D15-8W]BES71389.1 sarcosine oxidase subunit gamma family protein [Marinobacter nanhaiticus D15-8W]
MSDLNHAAITEATKPGVALMDQRPAADVPARSPLCEMRPSRPEDTATRAGVFMWEDALKTHLILRGNGESEEFRKGVKAATGFELPGPLQSSQNDDWSLSWITPDEWLLIGPGDQAFLMEHQLRTQLHGHYAVINVGGGQTVVRLSGAEARSVIMKSCPYDVHDRNFPVGKVVTTVLAKSQATLRRLGDDDWAFIVRRSFADYIWRWLADAAGEYGLSIGEPPLPERTNVGDRSDVGTVAG